MAKKPMSMGIPESLVLSLDELAKKQVERRIFC